MSKPLVAIVGRPNVGKSTFFNRIVGHRISIVADIPGVTRDRIYGDAEWVGVPFTLIDTGGIEPDSQEIILSNMRMQAELAIETAQVILFFTDAKEGLTGADHDVAMMLRRTKKPVILVVNKADTLKDEMGAYEFYALGFESMFPISSSQGLGLGDLLDAVVSHFPKGEAEEEERIKIAIVGKPNAGKSSLANRILNQERSIVTDIAGTTRDAIDTPFEKDGILYTITDTAGMRKKGKIEHDSIERYSVIRSLNAVSRSDVVICMLDASEGITEQDLKIAGYVESEGKPCVIAVNKWDLISKDTYTANEFTKKIRDEFKFLPYVNICYISAINGQRVSKLFDLANEALNNAKKRITTGLLNDCVREAITASEPPSKNGRRLRIYYVSQVDVCPPKFLLFVNDVELLHFSYKRYLENYLRKTFDFTGTPIVLTPRPKKGDAE